MKFTVAVSMMVTQHFSVEMLDTNETRMSPSIEPTVDVRSAIFSGGQLPEELDETARLALVRGCSAITLGRAAHLAAQESEKVIELTKHEVPVVKA